MFYKPIFAIITAISLGFLEAAWTYPDRGGPFNIYYGLAAILVALGLISWPRPWWILGLAIIEEITHLYASGGHLIASIIFNHWSVSFLGGWNVYPYLLFPITTITIELCYQIIKRKKRRNSLKKTP